MSKPRDQRDRTRVGVVGVGKMGTLHLRKLLQCPEADVIGVFEINKSQSQQLANEFGVKAYTLLAELLFDVDAIVVASPTATHYAIAKQALDAGVHVLVEKPITDSVESALSLIEAAEKKGVILQVGLIERFRYLSLAKGVSLRPVKYIETQRLSPTLARENTVDVVTDLMIHDLDLALNLMEEDPCHVSAIGVPVLTPQFDMANVRLEFPGGAVVNLNASRVSSSPVRKFRVFAGAAYASMDFLDNSVKLYHRSESGIVQGEVKEGLQLDPLLDQAHSFLRCIQKGEAPEVSGRDGLRALKYATVIQQCIDKRMENPAQPLWSSFDVVEGLDGK